MRWIASLLLLAGCFSDPPEVEDGSATGGTTSATPTSMSADPTSEVSSESQPTTATSDATSSGGEGSTSSGGGPTSGGLDTFCDHPEQAGARMCEDFDGPPLDENWEVKTVNGTVFADDLAALGSPPNGLHAIISDMAGAGASIERAISTKPAAPVTAEATVRVDQACGTSTHLLGLRWMQGKIEWFRMYVLLEGSFLHVVTVDPISTQSTNTPTLKMLLPGETGRLVLDVYPMRNTVELDFAMTGEQSFAIMFPAALTNATEIEVLAGLPSAIGFGPCETSTDDIVLPAA